MQAPAPLGNDVSIRDVVLAQDPLNSEEDQAIFALKD